jgi:hypothetical protein
MKLHFLKDETRRGQMVADGVAELSHLVARSFSLDGKFDESLPRSSVVGLFPWKRQEPG